MRRAGESAAEIPPTPYLETVIVTSCKKKDEIEFLYMSLMESSVKQSNEDKQVLERISGLNVIYNDTDLRDTLSNMENRKGQARLLNKMSKNRQGF